MSKYKEYTDGIDAYEYCVGGLLGGILQKGLLYEKLSEELGCPLEVVFKALKEGIITNPKYNDETELMTLEYDDGLNKYGFVNLLDKYPLSYYLKDYGKTWWLKGENNDNSNDKTREF